MRYYTIITRMKEEDSETHTKKKSQKNLKVENTLLRKTHEWGGGNEKTTRKEKEIKSYQRLDT